MKTLIITDLARTEQLDSRAMAGVRGGWSNYSRMSSPSWKPGDLSYAPSHDASIDATQNLLQQQSVSTATANGAAFVHGVHVDSKVHQNGQNTIIG